MNTAKQIDAAIANFGEQQTKHQFRSAVRRLEAEFAEALTRADEMRSARVLIEHMHLAAGNRRTKVMAPQIDRRADHG